MMVRQWVFSSWEILYRPRFDRIYSVESRTQAARGGAQSCRGNLYLTADRESLCFSSRLATLSNECQPGKGPYALPSYIGRTLARDGRETGLGRSGSASAVGNPRFHRDIW